MDRQSIFLKLFIILLVCASCKNSASNNDEKPADIKADLIQPKEVFPDPASVKVQGFLGDAVNISEQGRLLSLPTWNDRQLIEIFTRESRLKSTTNDWYGEHAGKWLYSTALAVNRTSDEKLKSLLLTTADFLVSTQEKDGYLGTYSPDRRITDPDYELFSTSWDVWNLSYMVLGLLEVYRYFPDEAYLTSAKQIGEIFLKTFGEGKKNITNYGSHVGLSATVILDPLAELYRATRDERYLNLAIQVIKSMEEKEGLRIITNLIQNKDVSVIGDGKAYQLCWNLTAIAKLYLMTGNEDYLKAAENAWNNIKDFHLTVTGGPWGGIGGHIECFNAKGFWSPYGFVETCSSMSWIQFNREMLHITGEGKYAQEIERTAYNALAGAQYPDGTDWCYHTFTNGRTHTARFIDCCPSSGALALEELSPVIYSLKDNGIACNIYAKSEGSFYIKGSDKVKIIQDTEYPFEGKIYISVFPEAKESFPLFLRIPDWAEKIEVLVNDLPVDTGNLIHEGYLTLQRTWDKGDIVKINFPFGPKVIRQVENSNTPRQGYAPISSVHWFSLRNGPLVYAVNGLIGGKEREESYSLPEEKPESFFMPIPRSENLMGQTFELKLPGHEPLLFLPYYEAAGRKTEKWRLTWIQERIDR